jgi:hypothetical protein
VPSPFQYRSGTKIYSLIISQSKNGKQKCQINSFDYGNDVLLKKATAILATILQFLSYLIYLILPALLLILSAFFLIKHILIFDRGKFNAS